MNNRNPYLVFTLQLYLHEPHISLLSNIKTSIKSFIYKKMHSAGHHIVIGLNTLCDLDIILFE